MPHLHSPFPDTAVFWAAYWLWIVSEVSRLFRRRGKTKRRADRGSVFLVVLAIVLSVEIAFQFRTHRLALLPPWFFYPGILLMLLGIALRQWAIHLLGELFSPTVRIRQDHRLVQAGPYRLIRHPAYTGTLLTITGLGLALRSWGAALLNLGIFLLAYGYRIRVEERALEAEFGEAYRSYRRRTKALVPFLF